MDFFPEIPSSLGVNPGGRFVEKKQPRVVQQARSQRQPLFPATGEGSRQLAAAACQAQFFQGVHHRLTAVRYAKHAGDEVQVLFDAEVVPEGKPLGHVAYLGFDLDAVFHDVQPQAGSLSAVRGEQAAEHADGGGFAATIGTEKAENFTFPHLQGQILYNVLVSEMFVEPTDIDREGRIHVTFRSSAHPRVTLDAIR